MPATIAYILDHFPVYSETFILNEILELEKRGFRMCVFARHDTRDNIHFNSVDHDFIKEMKAPVIYIDSLLGSASKFDFILHHVAQFVRKPFRYIKTAAFVIRKNGECAELIENFKFLPFLTHQIEKRKVKHIHSHFAWTAARYSMLISMMSGIPYSFTAHAHDIFVSRFRELIEDKIGKAKFVATISIFNKDFLLKSYPNIDPAKIEIVHCGMLAENSNSKKQIQEHTNKIIGVGRFVTQKGFIHLIRACSEIQKTNKFSFQCKIIGSGQLKDQLNDEINKLGLQQSVQLMDAMEHSAVLAEIEDSNVFVLPCVYGEDGFADGIPVVLMEAMHYGVPVISTRISGVPELVKEGAGILVEPGNDNSLAAAIMEIFSMDRDQLQRMTDQAKAIMSNEFSLEKEVSKLARSFASPAD